MKGMMLIAALIASLISGNAFGEAQTVSLMNLIVTPERYEGKEVDVGGYLIVTFEGDSIWFSEDDAKHQFLENSLWLDIPEKDLAKYQNMSGSYVRLIGVFTAKEKGHFDLWSGAITVARMKPVPKK